MIWFIIAAAAVIGLFIAGGLEDEHHTRVEARREVDSARPGQAPAAAYREAHTGRHAAPRAHEPDVPLRPTDGS